MIPPQSKVQDIGVGRKLMNAIGKLQGKKGISLKDLKKYLKDTKKMDVGMLDFSIKLALKKAMDKGILTREDGNYKLKEAKRRSRSRSKGKKSSGRRRRRRSSGRKGRSRRKRSGSKRRKSSGKRRSRRRRKAAAVEEM